MNVDILFSYQFLIVALFIALIFHVFNRNIGPKLWTFGDSKLRKVLKVLEAIKMLWPPLMGFFIGIIPGIFRPAELKDETWISVALTYSVAGLCSQWVFKAVTKVLEARGIDIESEDSPRQQISKNRCN